MTVIPLCFDRKNSDNFEKSQLINGRSKDDMVVALIEFHADFLTGIQIEIFEEFIKISAFIRWILASLVYLIITNCAFINVQEKSCPVRLIPW